MRTSRDYVDDEAPTNVYERRRPASLPAQQVNLPDGLWDANDVAKYLKVSRSWVYHRAEAGLLPLRRVGGLLRFDPAAIRRFASGEPDDGPARAEARTTSPTGRRSRR